MARSNSPTAAGSVMDATCSWLRGGNALRRSCSGRHSVSEYLREILVGTVRIIQRATALDASPHGKRIRGVDFGNGSPAHDGHKRQ